MQVCITDKVNTVPCVRQTLVENGSNTREMSYPD